MTRADEVWLEALRRLMPERQLEPALAMTEEGSVSGLPLSG
jgi:hypothetical protein